MAKQRVFKSKKKVSNIRAQYLKWSEWRDGDVIVGRFDQEGKDTYGNPTWILGEVYSCSLVKKPKFAAALIGKAFSCNSAGQLDKAMAQVSVGDIVQIEYKGTELIEKGKFKGKDAHQFSVEVVEEDDGSEEIDEQDENEDEDDSYDDL